MKDGAWNISIGDVRIAGRAQPGAGSLRGLLIEVRYRADESLPSDEPEDVGVKDRENMIVSFLKSTFQGTGEQFDASKIVVCTAGTPTATNEQNSPLQPDWKSAKLYMEVLRGLRP